MIKLKSLLFSFLSIFSLSIYAEQPELAFLGYEQNDWIVVTAQADGRVVEIQLKQEPHTFDYDFKTGQILYIGSDGKLYLKHKNSEKEIQLPYGKNGYTQPNFSCKTDLVYIVELIEGKSNKTRIMSIDLNSQKINSVIEQNSSQFEPSELNNSTFLFTNLICNKGCGKLIQELWQKSQITGLSEQITLLNAFSNNPSSHINDNWVFFSSDKNNNYHIWGKDLKNTEKAVQLTFSDNTDTFPGAIGNGQFLYVSQGSGKYVIKKGNINGKSTDLKLSKNYKSIRQLKVNTCE